MCENTRARVFIHCFLVFGYPGETLALVVHILLTNNAFMKNYCSYSFVTQLFRSTKGFHKSLGGGGGGGGGGGVAPWSQPLQRNQ
jgi:hypothetical protein